MMTIIAAVSETGVIGKDGAIPWKLKNDMAHFKNMTAGHTVIMGRKTYESIMRNLGKPLPNRENIVISRTLPQDTPGITVVCSWEEALEKAPKSTELFVIGGAEVYQQALPVANALSLTRVHVVCEGDTHFPEYNTNEWNMQGVHHFEASDVNEHACTITKYRRKPAPSFINLAHARGKDQLTLMEQIEKDGVCPFCRVNFYKYHKKRIYEHRYWIVTESSFPYEGVRAHWLIIAARHVERIQDLDPLEWETLWGEIATLEQKTGVPGATVLIRSGDTNYTGGSVKHFHTHVIFGNTNRENGEPIRARVGYKLRE